MKFGQRIRVRIIIRSPSQLEIRGPLDFFADRRSSFHHSTVPFHLAKKKPLASVPPPPSSPLFFLLPLTPHLIILASFHTPRR
jgi:hypothetical protein